MKKKYIYEKEDLRKEDQKYTITTGGGKTLNIIYAIVWLHLCFIYNVVLSAVGNTVGPFFVGLGEPSYFYVEAVFFLNGLMMSVFFLFGVYLR